MYAKYLLKSLNSSIEGLNVMILQLGFGGLSEMRADIVVHLQSSFKKKKKKEKEEIKITYTEENNL